MSDAAGVRVTTRVPLDPQETFELFTNDVDAWWLHGPRFRPGLGEAGVMVFEPGVGGRLLERYAEGEPFELGRVRRWEAGVCLAFSLGRRDFGPGEETEVEVFFEAEGSGTRVRVVQRGFEALPAAHPARHGMDDEALRDLMSVWWADLFVALSRDAAR